MIQGRIRSLTEQHDAKLFILVRICRKSAVRDNPSKKQSQLALPGYAVHIHAKPSNPSSVLYTFTKNFEREKYMFKEVPYTICFVQVWGHATVSLELWDCRDTPSKQRE